MENRRHVEVSFNENGDLVWAGHDLGPQVGILMRGADEYEFWRTIRAIHVSALVAALGGSPSDDAARLVRERFDSDVALSEFAQAHDIPSEFFSWIPTPSDD